jgi:chromosome segregation protein
MRLRKLILHGFKSFADRTEFVFDAPIVGIVGPNGCGKSNVVDGFKWVLGEQSAKSLRGDAMMDVIFNGSGTRKPSGMAEVTLVFENPKREDGTRFLNIDLDEVAVGRRLFRDGTSEYQLNNQPSRLRDVRDLFLDTGVGVDAYSVIEQGRVAAMLESNPAERRQIFEEAAGISKYKVKKKEAQRKLERVDQNLLRLHDIVEEVEKRLRSVRIQAGRARTFQEHSARLNELRLSYSLQEYHAYHAQLTELDAKREDTQFRLDDISGDLQRKQNELAVKREALEQLSQRRQRLEHELVQARAQMDAARQRQEFSAQQLQQIADQLEAFAADRSSAEQKLAQAEVSLQTENEVLAQLSAELEEKRTQIEDLQTAFRDGQLRVNELAQEIEQHKSGVLDLMRKLAGVNSRISSIDIERRNLVQQQSRQAERRRVLVEELDQLEAHRQSQVSKLDELTLAIESQQNQLNERRSQALALDQRIARIGEQLGAAREHRSGLASRQNLLKDLENRREGVSDGVKAVLRQKSEKYPFIRGLVADVMRVDVEHARVIEAALDGRDQWLVADKAHAIFSTPEPFEDLVGRVNVLCADELEPAPQPHDWSRHPQRVRLAVDLVRFEPADAAIVAHLLGSTVVVESLAGAIELYQSGPTGLRYVTHAGEVLEPDGTLKTGPLTAAMGLLSRRSELDAITAQITEVDSRIETLSRQLNEGTAQAKTLEDELNGLRNAIYQSNTAKVELSSQIAQVSDRLTSLGRERPVLERELNVLADQISRLSDDESQLVAERQKHEKESEALQANIEAMSAQQTRLADELQVSSETLTACRIALGQVQEKQLATRQQVERQTALAAELTQQIERILRSADGVADRRAAVEAESINARRAEEMLVQTQEELASQAQVAARQLDEAQQLVQELGRAVDRARENHAEIEQSLHEAEMKLSELRVRLETLVNRAMEELQLDLPARYSEGYQPADMNWEAVGEEIRQLRDKIQRLGNVNLDSLSEQDELEQREQFLAKQVTDLTTSKQQLEELIDTINRESSVRFEQTFNAVREHFQGMFRKLFGGGKADVYLETELEDVAKLPQGDGAEPGADAAPKKVDILEAGIEIIAKPPGKQPATISQLSGGEKTMTCIALLMSIFKSKPSPFCLLDEVDAALDEANNQRFNLIVQEFLDMSQFIIITHSKRTMQIADVLYGVTMQEQGVSKRVAVKFDQIDSHGRIAEHAAA